MKVGYVLGDISGRRSSTFPTLIQEIKMKSDVIEPIVMYTSGNPMEICPSVEYIKFKNYPLPPHWHRLENKYEFDVIHLTSIPKWGHIPTILANTPIVATDRGTAHWCGNIPDSSERNNIRYKIDFQARDQLGKYTLDRVFAVSNYVKHTLTSRVGYNTDMVTTTYLGISPEYYKTDNGDKETASQLPNNYLLHVSNESPIKNVETLIDAFDRFLNEYPDYCLVIIGEGWEGKMYKKCKKLGIKDQIVFFGQVSDISKMVSIYDGADLYIQPSLHETFGRPIIESMARGTPVLVSDRCALKEVAENSAVFINNPSSGEEIAEKMSGIISNRSLQSELRADGLATAKKYKFDRYISRLEKEYNLIH
jgi:glycosyltransferase involved in cell wall biosynthesis